MVWQMRKKRLLGILLACILLIQPFSTQAKEQDAADEPDNLYAQSAVLMDADSGRVLFGKNENEAKPMASTTKIMTCILALENMEEGQIVAASDYAASQPKVRLGVRGKEEYYLKDILYSLMLESHNDSAVVVAEGIAGSVEAFAGLMNQKAREIGCKDTYFVTLTMMEEPTLQRPGIWPLLCAIVSWNLQKRRNSLRSQVQRIIILPMWQETVNSPAITTMHSWI